MQRGLEEIKSPEQEQGTRLAGYRAHPEWDRRLLSLEEQDLLRVADQNEQRIFELIGLKGPYVESREVVMGKDFLSGHPDVIRVYDSQDTTVIIDDKFGWHPVPPADVNLQVRCYALLAPTSNVFVAISQPRLPYADRITLAKYDLKLKLEALKQIEAIDERSRDPNAPLVAGEEQCRYCRARGTCPALRAAITKQLLVFEDLVPEELSKAALLGRMEARLAQATDTQLGSLLGACALARLAYTPLTDEIRRRLGEGGMEGYMLGKEIDVRKIADAKRAVSLLVLGGILTREQILEICELPIGRIETKYREQNDGMTAKEAKADVNRALASVIDIETRKPKILLKT
jgi:hypothetical protein